VITGHVIVYKHICEFPGCTFETDDRMQIEKHHIIPKSLGGSNKNRNRIWLCRKCHARIYIQGMTNGIHYKNNKTKIELLGWLTSTGGKVLVYKTFNGPITYYMGDENDQD